MRAQWMATLGEYARVFLVVLLPAIAIDLRRGGRHRRIHPHGKHGNPPLVFEFADQVNQLLRAADGKRRDVIPPRRRRAASLMIRRQRILEGLRVEAVAVG